MQQRAPKRNFSRGKVRTSYMYYDNCTNLIYFLAWDNLRIDVYGFIELTRHFLKSYPGYFLSPLRISGSAVESLFGQYKYMSGSKLDAANYATCRSKYLANQAVHHSGQFYRDQELSIPIAPLEKKKYSSKKNE